MVAAALFLLFNSENKQHMAVQHSKKTKNCFDCEYKKHSIAIFAICSSEIELILQQDSRGDNMRLII
ncbi:hypothetical protein T11_5172 [Trichinella zimbabwensis]|uniref:Uncharacterized protein n=1 Tax=Trichinella zimbabwensis TaxID=268475 RepID=A0A0V1G8N8_9BILA|nr:hypothetical protein T11_5172 [Trichinella zimbabwensis]